MQRETRSFIVLAALVCGMILAACLLSGCATAALHAHLRARESDEALRNADAGRGFVVGLNTPVWGRTHWDIIFENWYLYVGTLAIDAYCMDSSYDRFADRGGGFRAGDVHNHYYPPEPNDAETEGNAE